jgi:hypothetical protein
MSQSAIRYNGHTAYVKDEDLREFLKLLSFHLADVLRDQQNESNWIATAIMGWMEDHEGLPPGLRDIELDEVLADAGKVDTFSCFLTGLLKPTIGDGPYDKVRAVLVVKRVLSELEPQQVNRSPP